jgi:hypothetical protein
MKANWITASKGGNPERLAHYPGLLDPRFRGGSDKSWMAEEHFGFDYSWKLRRRPGSGQSIAANWPVPERVM